MKIKMLAISAAALMVAPLAAVTVGPEWCVAYPESGSKDVNRALRIAAEEVRDDLNEATALKLKAVPASQAKPPAIYVGAEFAKLAGLDLSRLKWYDNVIAEKCGNIYIFGNDRPGRDAARFSERVGWFHCVLPSVKAATRFLETFAGVRFLMPGEVGKEVPRCKAVSVPDGHISCEKPSQIYGSGRCGDNRSMIYLIANGIWGMGAMHTYGGHTYGRACPADKYFKDHPEYFGLQNGKRNPGPTIGQTVLCISNPKVEDLIVGELKRRFGEGVDVCQLGQQDGRRVCECEACKALYGTGDDWGEKFWIFHRRIAERILKECPGKIVQIISYERTYHPPKTFKVFPPNVLIDLCRYTDWAFREWNGYTVPYGFSVYAYLTGDYHQPGFVAKNSFAYLAMLVRRFHDNNVLGIYRCGGSGDLYGTEGPGYYVFNRLLLDGSLNVVALLDDYCNAAFGPAAMQMRKFYDIQDSRLRMYNSIIDEPFPSDSADGINGYVWTRPKNPLDLHGWMFSPDTVSEMESCLFRAESTDGLSAKQKKRLELVRLEFNYAKMMGEISTLYAAFKLHPSQAIFDSLADVIESRNAYMARLFGSDGRTVPLDGWPEVRPFGWITQKLMMQNGRCFAPIGVPLNWDVKRMREQMILPTSNVKTAEVNRVSVAPTFDEFMLDSGWADLGGMSMEGTECKGKFKVVCDSANLYVLVESDLRDDASVRRFPHDGRCWDDDCYDLLLSPGRDRDIYYHLIWNVDPASRYDHAFGLIKSPLDPSYGKPDATWNGMGWKTESQREDGKWRTIATLPYSDFGVVAPKTGDYWFMNVGRIARSKKNSKEFEYLLWSPNMESRNFEAPNAMGKLIFK